MEKKGVVTVDFVVSSLSYERQAEHIKRYITAAKPPANAVFKKFTVSLFIKPFLSTVAPNTESSKLPAVPAIIIMSEYLFQPQE